MIMAKRFYNIGELVWSKKNNEVGVVTDLYPDKKEMTVLFKKDDEYSTKITEKFWEFDKLREKKSGYDGILHFAKVRDSATIPTKKDEDAGYDIYLDFPLDHKHTFEGKEIESWTKDKNGDSGKLLKVKLKQLTTNILPTGLSVRVGEGFYTDWANERGSTGKQGILMLSGVVDSGYRGEVFLNVLPLVKDVIITNDVDSLSKDEIDNFIVLDYKKAISQMIPRHSLKMYKYTTDLDELLLHESERGHGALGESGK